jgi:hypothetical protein
MRSILGITLLLFALGLLSFRIEGRSADLARGQRPLEWVRTVDGWEQPLNNWRPSLAEPPAVHPLLVAAGQTLISFFALAAAASSSDRKSAGE